jgi:hypothetical protein
MSERWWSSTRGRNPVRAAGVAGCLIAFLAAEACAAQTATRTDRPVAVASQVAPPPQPGGCGDAPADQVATLRSTADLDDGPGGPGGETRPPDQPPPRRSRQYAALLHEGDRNLVIARRLSRAAFRQRHQQLTAQGYSLEDFEVVDEGIEPCFSGVWHAGASAQRLELGLALPDFVQADAQSTAGGRPPADVETYVQAGQRLFAGLWRDDAHGNLLITDVDRARIETTVGGVRRLVDLESWSAAGGRRYMAIHEPSSAPARLFFGQTFAAFGAEAGRQIAAGFQPVELEIEQQGGEARYTTAWKPAAGGFWLFVGLAEPLQDCRLVSLGLESPELRPFDPAHCRSLASAASAYARPNAPTPQIEGYRQGGTVERLRDADFATAAARLGAGPGLGPDPVPVGTPPLHLIDFSVTRSELLDPLTPPVSAPTHRGVLHDSGASGPPDP